MALGLALALLAAAPAAAQSARTAGQGSVDEAGESGAEGPLVPPGPPPDLILIYTGRVRGFVEPCGCPRNPAGGISRRAGYLELLEKEYPKTRVVLLETGEFASEFDEPGRLKTGTYVEALGELGYDAVGLGQRELAGGLDAFAEIFGERALPLVSASFTVRGSDETLVDPYIVKEYKLDRGRKLRVGFMGLTSHNSIFASRGREGRSVVTRDPVVQARRYLPMVKQEADFVILLANLNGTDIGRVVKAVPGAVDLVLAAFSDRLSPWAMEEIGGVPTFYAGDRGRRLGEVRVFLDESGVEKMTAHQIHLTRRYPEVDRYQRVIGTMLTRVNSLMKEKAIKEGAAPAVAAGGLEGEEYVLSSRCLNCHDAAYRVWEHSRHAHAMETLVSANQDYNPECISCHSTGYGKVRGFRSASATPGLANVHCEACHGPGAFHVEDTSAPYGNVPPRVCFSCHTRENSPDFSFFKYWNTIKH